MQQLLSRPSLRGFGATSPAQVGISTVGSAGSSLASMLLASGAVAGPVGLLIGGVSAAIVALAPIISGVINGCGETCQVTTEWANQAEQALQQNIDAYFSLPVPRSTVDQQAALANFTSIWNALVSNCNNPSLGNPGQRCITDRQAGACTWKQPASSVPPWGTPAAGACWNWWNGYHDPIANDPNVYTPSATTSTSAASSTVTPTSILSSVSSSLSSLSPTFLLAAGGLLLAVVLLGDH
jgi:hypothetical protein